MRATAGSPIHRMSMANMMALAERHQQLSPHERLLMSHLQCDIGQSRGACALTAHARYAIEGSSSPMYAPLCPPQPVVRPGP